MKRKFFIIIALALLLGGAVLVWNLLYPTYSYRYRLTVEIDTPEGVKSGSSVVEIKTNQYPTWVTLGANSEKTTVKGEATVIDLGNGNLLFALLETEGILAPHTFLDIWQHSRPLSEYAKQLSQLLGHKAEVPTEYLPRMVRFRDLGNPETVELVLQAGACELRKGNDKQEHYGCIKTDNFSVYFGEGAKLSRVVLEITDDKITSGIEKQLPWIWDYRNKLLDGRTTHTIMAKNRVANSIGSGSFSMNMRKEKNNER